MLVMSIASHAGHLKLAEGFEWISSEAAIAAFAVATLLEVAAYYVPWVDNLLDSVAIPAAIIAGTLTTAAAAEGMSPFLQWSLAVIVGGGAAGTIQGVTTLTRLASTAVTGGLGNPILSTVEITSSVLLSTLAVVAPLLAVILVVVLITLAGRRIFRKRWSSRQPQVPSQQ